VIRTAYYIVCLLFPSFLLSQENIRFERINSEQGLSNQEVKCIFQDKQGFIWFGTSFGLNRFDGIHCKTYYYNKADSNSLVHNNVLRITEDANGNLWIGTQEGVSCFNPGTETFTNYSATQKGRRHFSEENCHVFADKKNRIWVGHSTGLSLFDSVVGRFQHIPLRLTATGTKRNEFVTSFLEDSKGRLWVSTSYGIRQIDTQTLAIREYILDESGNSYLLNACRQIKQDSKGRIFVGTWGFGVLYYDEVSDRFVQRRLSIGVHSKPQNIVHSLQPVIENEIHYLYLGTEGGLVKIKTDDLLQQTQQLETYIPDKLNSKSISSSYLFDLLQDRSRHFWIATTKGVCRIDPYNQQFQSFALHPEIPTEDPVYILTTANSRQYFASTTGFSFLIDKNTHAVTPVFIKNNKEPISIYSINKGRSFFWIASTDGLLQCDSNLRVLKKFNQENYPLLPANRLSRVLEDHTDKIWMGSVRNGIVVLDPSNGNITRYLHDSTQPYLISPYYVQQLKEDSRKNIWIGTTGGLYLYDRKKNTFQRFVCAGVSITSQCNNIQSILETKDGMIWIASKQGLRVYDPIQQKMNEFSIDTRLFSDYVKGIVEDDMGLLWFATNNGLIQYNRQTRAMRSYTTLNGFLSNDMTGTFYKNESGSIFIGFAGAIQVFNPALISTNSFSPAPLITAIKIDNTTEKHPLTGPLSIRYNQSISIDFIALNYSNPENNQYAYKLDGIDKEWIPLQNTRNVRFSNLPAGSYTFQLKAANNDGIWNEQSTDLLLTVTPPFWKTSWFILLSGMMIVTGIYSLYRYRIKQLLDMQNLRISIATDLHDDIGATLSSISMYSDALKNQIKEKLPQLEPVLDKMGKNSRDMVSSMSDIVWAINPDNDEGKNLIQRMEQYARDLCAIKIVKLHFYTDDNIQSLKFPLEKRKNIYLVFKEALNNALKYSQATEITISLRYKSQSLQLVIKDNGKGFDIGQQKTGNGLKNMQTRAREINASIKIGSGENEGTTVAFTCEL